VEYLYSDMLTTVPKQ